MSEPNTSPSSFSRSVNGGKRSSKIEGRVTDETKFDLQRRCHELGMTESEYMEQLIEASLYGVEHVRSVQQSRLNAVIGLSGLGQGGT